MDFDEHLTSPARLAILASLFPGRALTFTELKGAAAIADGNLHVQTGRLAAAGYIEISKSARGRRTLTRFRITELGVESLKLYVRRLQAVLATEGGEVRARAVPSRQDDAQVWR